MAVAVQLGEAMSTSPVYSTQVDAWRERLAYERRLQEQAERTKRGLRAGRGGRTFGATRARPSTAATLHASSSLGSSRSSSLLSVDPLNRRSSFGKRSAHLSSEQLGATVASSMSGACLHASPPAPPAVARPSRPPPRPCGPRMPPPSLLALTGPLSPWRGAGTSREWSAIDYTSSASAGAALAPEGSHAPWQGRRTASHQAATPRGQ